mmetsp:Transcript_29839/g.86640  ORF Transcript_29839/g.86640 Transcript_29839/m.86640 type:complete len:714 (-) Transcript_29839:103-2244(-)
MAIPPAWLLGCYAIVLLGVAWKAGFAFVLGVLVLGAIPAVLLVNIYAEELAPLTGLVPKSSLDEVKRLARKEEREMYVQLTSEKGGESAEWLNLLLQQMWPHIAEFGEKTITDMEETINAKANIPGGIRFTKCSLGKEPIRFGPIKPRVVPSYYGDEYLEEGGVELQIGLSYHSDVEIMLATKFASVGVAALDIAGTLSVLFAPLISEAPFFGGLQILFTNPPKVDLDFKGIGNLADVPGIYSTVRKLIDDAIAGILVTPHRIAKQVSLDHKVDLARLKCPPPEGVLGIRVVRAENLAGKDLSIVGSPTSDPYVTVKVGSDVFKTPTIAKDCNPVWDKDNSHEFMIYSSEQCAQIDIFDWDRIGTDDPLGSLNNIPVRELRATAGQGPQPWKLHPRGPKDEAPPEDARVYLDVNWSWLTQPLDGNTSANTSKFVLAFKIDECVGLPITGLGGPFTVRLKVRAAGSDTVSTKQSAPGWSKWSSTLTPATLDTIRMLHSNGCSSKVIAESMEFGEDLIENFVQNGSSQSSEQWLLKLGEDCGERESNCNPQFEEVLLVQLPTREVVAEVELVSDPKKRSGMKAPAEVVARFEVALGSQEVTEGPFALRLPDGAPAAVAELLHHGPQLHGNFTLWRLSDAAPAPSDQQQAIRRRVSAGAPAAEVPRSRSRMPFTPFAPSKALQKPKDMLMGGFNSALNFGKSKAQIVSSALGSSSK